MKTMLAVEDIYGLSPLQQGMLFHTLYAPGSGVYLEQVCCRLRGRLDVTAFESAWQQAVDGHAILRTSFVWQRRDTPLQIVHAGATLRWRREDWRELAPADQKERIEAYLDADRRKGLRLEEAPLMHMALFRLADEEHELVWTFHHLLLDGWSSSLLLDEVGERYAAACRGEVLRHRPSRPYRDYIVWLADRDRAGEEEFWRRELGGFTAPARLARPLRPVDSRRQEVAGQRAGEASFTLSEGLTTALGDLARGHQITLNTLVQGAVAILLGRASGQEDVVFAITVSGRSPELSGVETMVGLFINAVPVRVRVAPHERLLPWLAGLQRHQAELLQHSACPLVDVQSWSELHRGVPLFETLLVFENYPVDDSVEKGLCESGLEVLRVRSLESTSDPLTIIATPGKRLSLRFLYDADRFDSSTIEGLAQGLRALLEAIAADPRRRLADLPLLSEDDRRRVLVEWNDTITPYPRESTIPELFEARARERPGAVALEFEGQWLSYGELDARADLLARRLEGLGVGPESAVGLCAERSPEMIVGMLATLKAGGVVVPLDPGYPRDRLAVMLADSGAQVLLAQRRLVGALPEHVGRLVLLDPEEKTQAWGEPPERSPGHAGPAQPRPGAQRRLEARNLAAIIYTSGSTGRPKGVAVTHRGIVRLVKQASYARMDPGQVFLQLAPISFDASLFEIWGSLLNGSMLVIMPPGAPSLEELGRAIQRHGVTTLWLTAPLFHLIAQGQIEVLSGVRQLLAGGDVLSVPAVRRAVERLAHCRLLNGYGPTEGTTFTCCHEIRAVPPDGETVPIGRPISNTRVYVLDRQLHPLPAGLPGEMFIGGDGLARCYLNDPELTAERFLPDPFAVEPGSRLYRTGDRARWIADGSIEFLGRLDDQLKVRGFRIEPGEVEARLAEHPSVREAAVVARQEGPADRRLVAYFVACSGASPSPAELKAFLRERLPEHMVPSAVVAIETLPRSLAGKVDRRALPEPPAEWPDLGKSPAPPRTPVEELLAGIWTQLLPVDRIGLHDSFLELGGHSLLATQAVSRIREAFGVELPLRLIFEAPTVAALAAEVELRMRGEREPPVPPVRAVPHEAPQPPSFAQQRVWFFDQLQPNSSFYNLPLAVRLEGALDAAALERSLEGIAARHESLRTTFATVEGLPVQVISSSAGFELPVVDLTEEAVEDGDGTPGGEVGSVKEARRDALVRRLATEEAQRPFDLSRGPLMRGRLLRLSEREHVLLLTLHHIVADGWSLGVLVRETGALYEAFTTDRPSPLPALPVQYADYAAWQREWLRGESMERQVSFWRRHLSGMPPSLELPTDRPRPAVQTFRGGQRSMTLPRELAGRIESLARRNGSTTFMTLLAAFQTLLHRLSGQEDFAVGVPIANRNRAETEGLIGFFVNTLVLRADLSGDPTFEQLLERVRARALEAYAHQDLPFEQLVEAVQPARDLSRSPLFQAMFDLQNSPMPPLELAGLRVTPLPVETVTSKFDLNLSMSECEEGLAGTLEFDADLFDPGTIDRMLDRFRILLEGIAADPDRRVSELPMMEEAERRRVVSRWNDTRVDWPVRGCLHELLEAQARRSPKAVAVEFEGSSLTYAQLDRSANQLAHHLRSLGVGPDVPVGVCLDRSIEMVIAIHAVLKAGGAYMPLDPTYPRERLAWLLADSRAPAVLTVERLRARVPASESVAASTQFVCVDSEREEISRLPVEPPRSSVAPAHLAYVIHTSGSTGKPKGVMVPHEGIVNRLLWMQRIYGLTSEDRVLQKTPFTFDVSVWELFWPLLAGARLVVARPGGHQDSSYLAKLIAEGRVTTIHFVPSLLAVFLEEPAVPRCSALKRVICSGEPLRPALRERFFERVEAELHNLYGPTEASVDATAWACERGVPAGTVPIGRPIANTRIFLLDQRLRPVPAGVPGELHIGGIGLARGYLGRPDLTAEKFLPDPLSGEPGARLYATGDRARYLPGGSIEFLGRIDDQVKVRGFRIEPGEVEATLRLHPKVRDCAVVAREGAAGDTRLFAYVVLTGDDGAAQVDPWSFASSARSFLKERLPEFMVPSAFVPVDAFPLTASGKLDRKALPEPGEDGSRPEGEFVAPRTALEEALVRIWKELLGAPRVGARDNFFDLGGHSLLATQALHRVRELFGVELPLRALFESPTVLELAAVLAASQAEKGRAERIAEIANRIEGMSVEELRGTLKEKQREGELA